ncbi:MAG TPA: sigma-54 dependent transcriptional regulator [Candidatus Polarisedimenticolaceae bacterium]|nr:sigma-54 dependent transcriptional regulator [Candidatus Polarisedimenticolaceae bacterium]
MERAQILVADDEREVRDVYARVFSSLGHDVAAAVDGEQVVEQVRDRVFDLVLCDIVFPPTDGIDVLRSVKRVRPSTPVVLFTGHASVDRVLDAFRAGAFDVLEKPIPHERLKVLADRAIELRKMGDSRRRLAEDLEHERMKVIDMRRRLALDDPFCKIIGRSGLLTDFVDTIREVARTDSTVLLTGESGTGKSLVARTIHQASARAEGPFVEANCVVYSEGVLQSELFGHEKGAFTGAERQKKGRFELADRGTLFLDEIGEIAPSIQLMLLRVLQERNFERVGGERTIEANVRLIAATNRDLEEAIRQNTFRSDLYYRLNVIPIHLPALRDHAEDIPVLAQHFTVRSAGALGRETPEFSEQAMEALTHYGWPGNVRELENVVERVVVLARTGRVELRDLPEGVRAAAAGNGARVGSGTLQDVERARILDVLDQTGGNKRLAARRLGIHRSTLYAKLRRYGLLDRIAAAGGDRTVERTESRQPVSGSPTTRGN